MKMHLNCELQAVCDCGSASPMDECDSMRWYVIAGDPYSGCGRAAAVLMLTVTRPVSNFKCESYPRPGTGTSFPPWLQSQPTSPLSTGTQDPSRGQSGAMRLRFKVNGP